VDVVASRIEELAENELVVTFWVVIVVDERVGRGGAIDDLVPAS